VDVSAARPRAAAIVGTVLLASGLWWMTFALELASFWVKISISASLLAAISLLLRPPPRGSFRWDAPALAWGLASAVVLYGIFWAGKAVSTAAFPFAGGQIGSIYHKGDGTPLWTIAVLLFCVTGPSEEIYWRGFLQQALMDRLGRWGGWAAATALYAGVHIWSFNFMLVGAAAVAGAFWGALYARCGRLAPVIVSHSIWSTVIFAVFPMR
jgi:membrane protease YdiL (CAAX protease family)